MNNIVNINFNYVYESSIIQYVKKVNQRVAEKNKNVTGSRKKQGGPVTENRAYSTDLNDEE